MSRRIRRLTDLIRLAYNVLMNDFAIMLYKNIGIDFTTPTVLYAQLTNACNSKCKMCDIWREKQRKEVPASVWINALKQLKSVNGYYKIAFAGGEVLLKRDVYEIFEFCYKSNLPFGITTNGYLLNQENINRLLEFHPTNINISLDSLNEKTYQKIRGVPFLKPVKSNIEYLKTYIEKNNLNTRIFLKTVVNAFNLTELNLLANYAMEMKLAGITFDPIRPEGKNFLLGEFDEFEKMSNIDMKVLQDSKNRLVEMKRKRYNILNSEKNISDWFNNDINNKNKKPFCTSPLNNLYIFNEGQIRLCDFTESTIGNILNDDIRMILKSDEVKAEKKKLTQCKNPCVYSIHRNIFDYLKLFNTYLRN